jgi:pimeloyl-ACP methyl ester carboxylesterase
MKKVQSSFPSDKKFFDIYIQENSGTFDRKHTIYFLGPFGGKQFYFQRFIKQISRLGYRIVFLQPDLEVLSPKHPDWLNRSMLEASSYIRADRKQCVNSQCSLLGVSLGAYIGLNVLQEEKFQKFVVIAAGIPLQELIGEGSMFSKYRKKFAEYHPDKKPGIHFIATDSAFKNADLSGVHAFVRNSHGDMVLKRKYLKQFLSDVEEAGITLDSKISGILPHPLQVLSTNFRVAAIHKFLQS